MQAHHESTAADRETAAPKLHVAPGPHLHVRHFSTRRMMLDVLLALGPVLAVALWMFRGYALLQLGLCIGACLAAEAGFTAWRKRPVSLGDGSAVVTGALLAFSLPAGAPWFAGILGGVAAIGLGKMVYGGLGQNLFNPAMVGRAFVVIAFPAALGVSAYILPDSGVQVLTQATPMTLLKQSGEVAPLAALFLGTTNGCLGEISALACLLGGLYLCFRRTAAWQIPAGMLLAVAVLAGLAWLPGRGAWTPLHELFGGGLMLGAFFIATDPVTSPLTPRGRWIFGVGTGMLVLLMRRLSGYPEGVMYAVLLMNAVTPLINRWTIPVPVGGSGN